MARPSDTVAASEGALVTDDPDGVSTRRRRRRGRRRTVTIFGVDVSVHLLEWIALIAGALAIALLVIKPFVFQAFYIPSESMYPTLKENDRVLVNKLSYRLHDVHRGDVVVFKAPAGEGANGVEDLVKRVVGLPGETIEGRDGRVYIDGELLEEPYLPDDVASQDFGPKEVAADHFFVLGDNRQNSKDSTYFGQIPGDDVIGRVFVKLWPPGDIGFL